MWFRIFQSLEVVDRGRDTQLQVAENWWDTFTKIFRILQHILGPAWTDLEVEPGTEEYVFCGGVPLHIADPSGVSV